MAGLSTAAKVSEDILANIRQDLAEKPDGVLEAVAAAREVPYRTVLECIDGVGAVGVPADTFDAIWEDMTTWGTIMFIVHTEDGVFETKGALPLGKHARGYFNIHGDSPIGGHLKVERIAAIYFVDRPFFSRRSCSVQFLNHDGAAMFKVFVGRDAERELNADQVERFEALRNRVRFRKV